MSSNLVCSIFILGWWDHILWQHDVEVVSDVGRKQAFFFYSCITVLLRELSCTGKLGFRSCFDHYTSRFFFLCLHTKQLWFFPFQVDELTVDLETVRHDLANQEVVKEHLSHDIDNGVQRIQTLEAENKQLQLYVKQYQQQLHGDHGDHQMQLELLEKEKHVR